MVKGALGIAFGIALALGGCAQRKAASYVVTGGLSRAYALIWEVPAAAPIEVTERADGTLGYRLTDATWGGIPLTVTAGLRLAL